MKRLFGTDGIRGVAFQYPLDLPTVRRFGAALADVLQPEHRQPCRLVLGRDTRESGTRLRDAVACGLGAGRGTAVDAGVISTPGLAHLVRGEGFDAGVMISASHNPFQDNGLKVFGRDGFKLSDDFERRIEERILDGQTEVDGADSPPVTTDAALIRRYVAFLEGVITPRRRLSGQRVILDCANGSASGIAPDLFRHHGAEVRTIGAQPDGRNINLGCGSLHLEGLAREVRQGGFDLGIAFDGDADRALAVDRTGRLVDGDHILYLAARQLKRAGRLRGDAVVATIMSNLWLEKRLAEEGIRLHRAPVGDKYVLERMLAEDLILGGEQSGHIIFRDHATTGDGMLTGLLLVEMLLEERQPLEAILDGIVPFPQVQLSVRVRHKPDLRDHPRIGPAVADVEQALASAGRVVLRYSGTEPLARVMVEGTDAAAVRDHAERLARCIQAELGA